MCQWSIHTYYIHKHEAKELGKNCWWQRGVEWPAQIWFGPHKSINTHDNHWLFCRWVVQFWTLLTSGAESVVQGEWSPVRHKVWCKWCSCSDLAFNHIIFKQKGQSQKSEIEHKAGHTHCFVHCPLKGSNHDDQQQKHYEKQHNGAEESTTVNNVCPLVDQAVDQPWEWQAEAEDAIVKNNQVKPLGWIQ